MEVTTQEIINILLVQVAGRIDHTTAQDFENTLLPRLTGCSGERQKALLDLSNVAYLSSAGLRVLMLAAKQCQKQQGHLVIAALPPLLQEVFRISRFDKVFTVFETVQTALEDLSPGAAVSYAQH